VIRTPKGILLTSREFEALLDYSCSLPTGTTVGKQWRRRCPYSISAESVHRFYLGEYVECSIPGEIGIEWTEILLPDGYVPKELRSRPQSAHVERSNPDEAANPGEAKP
jgi:hypothetical protein